MSSSGSVTKLISRAKAANAFGHELLARTFRQLLALNGRAGSCSTSLKRKRRTLACASGLCCRFPHWDIGRAKLQDRYLGAADREDAP
jgi:hypothetical protein